MTAEEVKDALRRRHGCHLGTGQWVCIAEAFSGWATMGGGVDLLAIGAWRSAKAPGLPGAGRGDATNPVVSYEVKVSRSDFRRELYGVKPKRVEAEGPWRAYTRGRSRPGWPAKAAGALQVSHFYLFATPAGLLKDEEVERREPWPEGTKGSPLWLPPEAGLLEVTERGCEVRVPALRRPEPKPWGRHATAELIRHAVDPNAARLARERITYLEAQVQRLNAALSETETGVAA